MSDMEIERMKEKTSKSNNSYILAIHPSYKMSIQHSTRKILYYSKMTWLQSPKIPIYIVPLILVHACVPFPLLDVAFTSNN